MSNNLNSKKLSKPFGILIAILVLALAAIIATMGITGAWFTDNDSKTKDSSTPNITVALVNSAGTALNANGYIDLNASTTVSVKVDANVDVYIRAKVIPQFLDNSENIVTGYDVSDYYTITYNANWGKPSGYNANFDYYGSPTLIATKDTTNAITTPLITAVSIKASLPAGVSAVRLQVFAEAVQGNAAGLAKWAA